MPTASGPNKDLPKWAQTLLARPAIEFRRGISFGYNPPTEKSSVIAITAPSGRYVDIRFPVSEDAYTSFISNKTNGLFSGFATAGIWEAEIQERSLNDNGGFEGYPCMSRVTWHHPINSSGSFDPDCADMFLLDDGGVMEVGVMQNLETGKVELFKEYWESWSPQKKPEGREMAGAVAELVGAQADRGMLIRCGDFVQGIVQIDEGEFLVERWEKKHGEWTKDGRSNTEEDKYVPCSWLAEPGRAMGDQVQQNGRLWQIVEVFEG